MTSQPGTLGKRFLAVALPFFRSDLRWRALGMVGLLPAFILSLNGLNVVGSFMCRNFTTAVADHVGDRSVTYALLWAAVLGSLTVVAVFKAFTEDRLRLYWRAWLTRNFYERYLSRHAYYRLQGRSRVDNPDQRITEDVRSFTEQTLAMFLILTNSVITLLSFCGILWSITPWLLWSAVGYAVFGTVVTVLLGKRMVKLDVHQFRKEADLRYDLIQVRAHAEAIALLRGEPEEGKRLRRALDSVVENMKGIIGLGRNIGFFTTGFEYLTQIIPLVVVAPLVIRGEVEFGMLAQGQMAFFLVIAAFSVIVKEFQRISTFGAVIERLGVFDETLNEVADPPAGPLTVAEDTTRVAFVDVTLTLPGDGRPLVSDLTVAVPRGRRLLIRGPSGSGRTTLVRAVAGLWTEGRGRVDRPPLEDVMFLPQQPYLRRGRLRDQLLYGIADKHCPDKAMRAALSDVGLGAVLDRPGGLDAEADWGSALSLGEQQRLVFARLLLAGPAFAFLDEPTRALDPASARQLYELLAATPVTYVSIAGNAELEPYHDKVIELGAETAAVPAEGGENWLAA
jgi:putative ATP-binding cassette transporter